VTRVDDKDTRCLNVLCCSEYFGSGSKTSDDRLAWKGGLVAVITFGCLISVELVTRWRFRDQRYYQTHGWPKLVGFWMAAALVFACRSWLGDGEERTLIDKETGREVMKASESSLFFIPIRFWPVTLIALGVVFFFVRD
jgi:hypothetical protein